MKYPAWIRIVLAVSLALNLGVGAALMLRPVLVAPPAGGAQPAVRLADYLRLTPGQRARWEELEKPFLHELASNWSEIRRHREALVRQIFAATSDRAAIDAEQAAIARLQAAQQQRVIAQLLAEREMLDENQRAGLQHLLLGRYAQEATEEELLHRN